MKNSLLLSLIIVAALFVGCSTTRGKQEQSRSSAEVSEQERQRRELLRQQREIEDLEREIRHEKKYQRQ